MVQWPVSGPSQRAEDTEIESMEEPGRRLHSKSRLSRLSSILTDPLM